MPPNFLLTVLALILARYEEEVPFQPVWQAGFWATFLASLLVSLAYGVAGTLAFGLPRREGSGHERWERPARLFRIGVLPLFAFELYGLGWRDRFLELSRGGGGLGPFPFLAGSLLLLVPFLVAVAAAWGPAWRAWRSQLPVRPGFQADCGFFVCQARQYLAVLAGVFLFFLFVDLLAVVPEPVLERLSGLPGGLSLWCLYAVYVVVGYLLMPWVLRLAWGVRALPEGPLRDRLERLCQKAGCRPRIRLWNTRSTVLNACTVGLLPSLSTIVMTDALIERLSSEDVEAVCAHELGHLRGRHFLYYLLFTLLLLAALVGLDPWLSRLSGSFWTYLGGHAAIAGVVWGILFGLLSRRLERQADLLGAVAVGNTARMQGALSRIAALSGQPPRLRTLTHGSIQARIVFLGRASADARLARRLHRTVLWIGVSMSVGLGLALALVALMPAP